jgi:dephospho-CoA kinase/inosine/xanthosine triphosphate pyrophosphatase family protein
MQARLVFSRFGQSLRHYRGHREPYDEDESLGTEELLSRAVKQVAADFGVRSVFFVEDTSLRIEALSSNSDYPGLSVKRWFSETSFSDLNRQIELRGGDRRVTVKSDIALYVPTLPRPIFFHGETGGVVSAMAPNFEASGQYPWLTPKSFNGWFIPDGARQRLGEMEFESSMHYDFRVKSLISLIGRLEELNSALNLSPSFYTVRRPMAQQAAQLWLPGGEPRTLIVIGHKCAGKTTLIDHLAARGTAHVFEASTVLRDLATEEGRKIDDSKQAFAFLQEKGFEAVAARIGNYLETANTDLRVISGLRTVEEILHLRLRFPQAQVLLVDSDSRVRFERHIRRARDQDVKSFNDFLKQDEDQRSFGAMRVAGEIADAVIHNNGSLPQYLQRVDDIIETMPTLPTAKQKAGELKRCLRALSGLRRTATCEEISKKTIEIGEPVRRYNTNRALKEVPEFADRVQGRGLPLRYRLTSRGQALLRLLEL